MQERQRERGSERGSGNLFACAADAVEGKPVSIIAAAAPFYVCVYPVIEV